MDFIVSDTPVDYPDAVAAMEAHVAVMLAGQAGERVWLLEHPPLYTAGTSAKTEDLKDPRFPVYQTGRGGQYTYHGPGQRVAYAMLDLKKRYGTPDVRRYVHDLEEWMIKTMEVFEIKGEKRDGRIGIWVMGAEGGEAKIAALGIRVRRGVAFHGVALNVNPDLSHYAGIVPCGIKEYGVTSMAALGKPADMARVDVALRETFFQIFK